MTKNRGPQQRKMGRREMMDIAKIIRNLNVSASGKEEIRRRLTNYFAGIDHTFDRQTFSLIATGKQEVDTRTEMHSLYSEKQDEI